MPIVKLSDKKTLERVYRFPHCLELAKGSKKPKRGSGKELPYWRVIERMPGAKAAFESVYGTEVTELSDAALAYDTPEQCFDSWVECQEPGVGGKFWWRSDGERSVIRWIPEKKTYSDDPEDQLPHAELPNHKWERNVGRLYVRLQGLARQGYSQPVLVRTGGINDIVRIAQFLHNLKKEVEQTYGPDQTLMHYLVVLWRYEVTRADPTSGGRYPHWDIGIDRSPLYAQSALQDAQDRAVAQLSSGNVRLLDVETGEFVDGDADYDPESDPYNVPDSSYMRDEDGNLTIEPDPEPEPTLTPDDNRPAEPVPEPHYEATEQDLDEPTVVGGQGAELPPAPKPPAEKKPKPKRTRAPKPKAKPKPPEQPEEVEELEGSLFEAMAQNGLSYDINRKAASLSGLDMNAWRGAATKLAEDCPDEFAKDGKPYFPHMLLIAGRLGYEKVGNDNLDEVMEKLREFDAHATPEQRVPF